MKKFILISVLFFLGVILALWVFIATFNVERYRPEIQKKISESLGFPVEFGHVSLHWKNGIALRLTSLTVYTDIEKSGKLLEAKGISAVIDLLSILQKEIKISSVALDSPKLHLVRRPNGTLLLPLRDKVIESTSSHNTKARPSQGLSIHHIDFRDGELFFEDQMVSPAEQFTIRDIDIEIKELSLDKPFDFDASAAVFSAKQNVHAKGQVLLPHGEEKGSIRKLRFESGLADWNLNELSRLMPIASQVEGNIGGRAELDIADFALNSASLAGAEGTLRLKNIAFRLKNMPAAVEKVQLEAHLVGDDIMLERFSGSFAGGEVSLSGEVKNFNRDPAIDLVLSAKGLSIEELSSRSRFGGHISFDFQGRARGFGPSFVQTLSGEGRLSLPDGVLLNKNLFREIVDKTSMIPGAEGMVERYLPPFYQAKLAEPHTFFAPIDLPLRAEGGYLVFDQIFVATDVLAVQGSGRISLGGVFFAQCLLRVDRTLTGVMAQIVGLIQVLMNSQGEVEVPIQFSGRLPEFHATLDKQYLTQKFIASQAQQIIAGFVNDPGKGLGGDSGLGSLFKRVVGSQTTEGQVQ